MTLSNFINTFPLSPLASWHEFVPWELTQHADRYVRELLLTLSSSEYEITGDIAIHRTAIIETGAVIKGPAVIGSSCFVAASAYVRGGNWLDKDCILGPGVELKSSFLFQGTKLAHFNFVGDSIIGSHVNMEAGSIVANYRNERQDKMIRVRLASGLQSTGVDKFGALVGDHVKVGANAVIAPGSMIAANTVIKRLSLFDQELP